MTSTSNYHHGNLRQALLDEAIKEIREHGVDKLSLRALARSLGVSQTAPYRHFNDKNALLAELAANAFNELADSVKQQIDTQHCALINTQAAGHAYLNYGINNPEKYRLMFGINIEHREQYDHLVVAGNGAFELLANLINQGQHSGVFIKGDAGLLASTCWSNLHGFVLLSIDGLFARRELPASPEIMQQHHVEFALRGLLSKTKR